VIISSVFLFFFLCTSQEIGWEEYHRNDLFCVEWDVKPDLSQSVILKCVYKLFWINCSREQAKQHKNRQRE